MRDAERERSWPLPCRSAVEGFLHVILLLPVGAAGGQFRKARIGDFCPSIHAVHDAGHSCPHAPCEGHAGSIFLTMDRDRISGDPSPCFAVLGGWRTTTVPSREQICNLLIPNNFGSAPSAHPQAGVPAPANCRERTDPCWSRVPGISTGCGVGRREHGPGVPGSARRRLPGLSRPHNSLLDDFVRFCQACRLACVRSRRRRKSGSRRPATAVSCRGLRWPASSVCGRIGLAASAGCVLLRRASYCRAWRRNWVCACRKRRQWSLLRPPARHRTFRTVVSRVRFGISARGRLTSWQQGRIAVGGRR